MATIETLRPEAAAQAQPPASSAGPTARDASADPLAAFRHGRGEEERLTDLLAFALAAERADEPITPGSVDLFRREASLALHDHAFRFLHNRVEEIRREAVAEQLGRLPRPPGFFKLVLANLLALAAAGGALHWLGANPGALAGLLGGGI